MRSFRNSSWALRLAAGMNHEASSTRRSLLSRWEESQAQDTRGPAGRAREGWGDAGGYGRASWLMLCCFGWRGGGKLAQTFVVLSMAHA